MAERSTDSTRATDSNDRDGDSPLAQPTVELNVLGARSAVADEPTVEQPIVRPGGRGGAAGQPSTAEPQWHRADSEHGFATDTGNVPPSPIAGLDDPTQEQPIVRPVSADPLPAGPGPAPAAAQPPAATSTPDPAAAVLATESSGAAAAQPGPAGVAVQDEADRFIAVVRRYGWVAAAAGVAAVALLCSAPFVSGNGLLWSPPAAPQSPMAPAAPTPEADGSVGPVTPTPTVTDTSPAAGSGAEGEPVPVVPGIAPPAAPSAPTPTQAPANGPSTPAGTAPTVVTEPVLLGPDNNDDLRRLLDAYCKQTHGGQWMAWPSNWPGSVDGRWACVRPWTSNSRDLDVRQACVQGYGEPVHAELTNSRDPLSWRCYRR